MLTIYPLNKNILQPVTKTVTHKEVFNVLLKELNLQITDKEIDVLYSLVKGEQTDNKKILNQLFKKDFINEYNKPHELFIGLFERSKDSVEIIFKYAIQDT